MFIHRIIKPLPFQYPKLKETEKPVGLSLARTDWQRNMEVTGNNYMLSRQGQSVKSQDSQEVNKSVNGRKKKKTKR